MKKIMIAGLYNSEALRLFCELVPAGFEIDDEATTERGLAGLPAKLPQADYLVVRGAVELPDAALDNAKQLRLIQKWGAGYNQYDVAKLGEKGIPFANSAGVNSVQVAEMSVLLMLALYRQLFPISEKLRAGVWAKEDYLPLSHTIAGKNVGIVGMGTIGKKVARIVQAFGAQVRYYDAFRLSPKQENALDLRYMSFAELFASSDVISLHLPLMKETHHIVNREILRSMKREAILVNAARGGIICEEDLVTAIREKWIAGAALDVFEDERAEAIARHPLTEFENVILTPHSGGSTAEVTRNMVECCLNNITAFDSGALTGPNALVNWAQLPKNP